MKTENLENKKDLKDPFVVEITNECNETKDCILFGESLFMERVNYGSELGISIANLQASNINYGAKTTYGHILRQSAHKPFRIGLVAIQASNLESKMISEDISFCCINADGKVIVSPIKISEAKSNNNSVYELESLAGFKISSNSFLVFKIPANSKITVQVYPDKYYNSLLECENDSNIKFTIDDSSADMIQGLIIWRTSFDRLVHIWNSETKEFYTDQLDKNNSPKSLHTEHDYKEAEENAKKIQQRGQLYFLTN
jgi:hypothetical protein